MLHTVSRSTPSDIDWMTFSTTLLWFPWGLSSRNLIILHRDNEGSQCTSTIRSSICSPFRFSLSYNIPIKDTSAQNVAETYSSHSSSLTYISSYCSYLDSPHHTCSKKTGLACQSGSRGFCLEGGKRRMSLKSIEFSEGGFHLRLKVDWVRPKERRIKRILTYCGLYLVRTEC